LAKDIVQVGLSPIDTFAVVGVDGTPGSYIVVEGNRRLCALKLLRDFHLAPAQLRPQFRKLAERYKGESIVRCVVFSNIDDASVWIERQHSGLNGGIGRKPWDADQKARFIKGKRQNDKNKFALELMDYAEKNNFITGEGRRGRLTTLQRYLSNAKVRELCLGLSMNDDGLICTDKSKATFLALAMVMIEDLFNGEIHSRAKKDEIDRYAAKLISLPIYENAQVSKWVLADDNIYTEKTENQIEPSFKPFSELVDPVFSDPHIEAGPVFGEKSGGRDDSVTQATDERLAEEGVDLSDKRGKNPTKPKRPEAPKYLRMNHDIINRLDDIGNTKLRSIYYSICATSLREHTPLLVVGAWSFLESLSVLSGRNPANDFVSFWSKERVKSYGFTDKESYSAFNQALRKIQEAGNSTKHHATACYLYAEQFSNDMETLEPLIKACLDSVNITNISVNL